MVRLGMDSLGAAVIGFSLSQLDQEHPETRPSNALGRLYLCNM